MRTTRTKVSENESARSKPKAIAHASAQLALNSLDRLLSLRAELNAEIKRWVTSAPPGKEKIRRLLFATHKESELLRLVDQHREMVMRIVDSQPRLLAAAGMMGAETEGADWEEKAVEQYTRRIMRASIERQRLFGLRMPGRETEEDRE